MSQFLNTNEIALAHTPVISWKGKTFTQITSSIKKNNGINTQSSYPYSYSVSLLF